MRSANSVMVHPVSSRASGCAKIAVDEAFGPGGQPRHLLRRQPHAAPKAARQMRRSDYIDPPFNSNRNYEVFWGETKEKRAFDDRHASTQAYIEFMRPRCVELRRVLKDTGSFYFHCDWHASHYVRVMLDQICGENNFQSEIIWHRTMAKGLAFTGFPNNHEHDLLLRRRTETHI
jgi:hypothetical protein